MNNIGFMQGRFSPMENGKIQSFPWNHWRSEFKIAHQYDFQIMEWTLDADRLNSNPIMSSKTRKEVHRLASDTNIRIESLTGDCFMQEPFYKTKGLKHKILLEKFERVLEASGEMGIKYVVVPLVDNGRIEEVWQRDLLLHSVNNYTRFLEDSGVFILFESDYPPQELNKFISQFNSNTVGINYDIGNSASFNYFPEDEIEQYGEYILNVHVKDRDLGGTTVPLGTGNADIPEVLSLFNKTGYEGNFILQTARAPEGNDVEVLCKYREMIQNWMEDNL